MRHILGSFFVFFVLSLGVSPSYAQKACFQVFQLPEGSVENHYYVGLLVRLTSGKTKLLVGPYLGRGHRGLFDEASGVSEILWGGELKVQEDFNGVRVVEANETSGFVQELIEQEGVYPYQVELASVENSVEALREHQASGLIIDPDADLQRFDPQREHLHEGLNRSEGNSRHSMGNKFQIALSYLGLLDNGHSLKEKQLSSLTEALKNVTNYALVFKDTHAHMLSQKERAILAEFIETSGQNQNASELTTLQAEALLSILQQVQPILLPRYAPATLYDL